MTRSFYRQFFLEHDAVLKPDTEAATTDQMLTLVKSELGLAFMPEPMAAPLLASGELVQLHLQEIIPSRSICLVYDHHRPLNTAARKFQQLLTKARSISRVSCRMAVRSFSMTGFSSSSSRMNISAKLTSKKQQESQMALPPSCAALLLPSPAPNANRNMMPK